MAQWVLESGPRNIIWEPNCLVGMNCFHFSIIFCFPACTGLCGICFAKIISHLLLTWFDQWNLLILIFQEFGILFSHTVGVNCLPSVEQLQLKDSSDAQERRFCVQGWLPPLYCSLLPPQHTDGEGSGLLKGTFAGSTYVPGSVISRHNMHSLTRAHVDVL